MAAVPTTAEVRALLVQILAGHSDEAEAVWRGVVGELHLLPGVTGARSNWVVKPKGNLAQVNAVHHAAEIVRAARPRVAP